MCRPPDPVCNRHSKTLTRILVDQFQSGFYRNLILSCGNNMTMLRYVALGMFCLTLMAVLKKNTESSGSGVTLEGHSRSLGETSVSLFNTLGLIDPEVTMLAIIIIVAAVLALETIFHMLNEVTRDTTFHRMVGAIEKELMLVGCTAFIFKIIVNAEIHVEEEWLIALEYSGGLLPKR